jgi:molybdopterin synthase catalytic subunit
VVTRRARYDAHVQPPLDGDIWLGLTEQELPIDQVYRWTLRPGCGAVVLFSGTVRDHAEGRNDVVALTYEAYDEQVIPRFATVADELRARWPDVGRVALLHRIGELRLEESSVVTAVSAPHRAQAFEAAKFAIDANKHSAPIWKRETWATGDDWATCASPIADVVGRGDQE